MSLAAFSISLSSPRPRSDSCSARVMWPMRLKNSSWVSMPTAAPSDASAAPGVVPPISGSDFFEFFKNLVELFIERGGRERLDHVAVGASLGGGDDVFFFRFGRDHQH